MLKYKRTQFGRADEVADSTHTTIILAFWFIKFNAHPLATSKFSSSTETESASLRKNKN